jgi:fucose 4-O-acetylase-like acetyltransferase
VTSAGTRQTAPAKVRVPLWDNARFFAIYLVVAGHAIQRLTGDLEPAFVIYLAIYSFHIPLFVLVSGHFSRPRLEGRDLRRILTDLVAPYVVFETIWTVIEWLVEGKTHVDYANASWTLWFLLALIWWRLLLPVVAMLKAPLLWATLLALAAGATEQIDSTLALSRTFALFPFFVLGWELRRRDVGPRWMEAPARTVRAVRIAAAAILTVAAIALVVGLPLWRQLRLKEFFFANEAYSTFGYDLVPGVLMRLAMLTLSAVLCLAVLAVLPRRQTWFTALGAGTLYVYLFHTFALYPLRETGILADNATVPVLLLMLVLAAVLTVVLASAPARRILRPLVEPPIGALLQPAEKHSSPG